MYYWPVLSAIIGVGVNFVFLVTTIGLIWFYESTKTPNNEMDTEQSQGFIRFLTRNRRTNGIFPLLKYLSVISAQTFSAIFLVTEEDTLI